MRYTFKHHLEPGHYYPSETHVEERGGKWYAFATVDGVVFSCPQPFDTQPEAYEIAKRDALDGINIKD